MKSVAKTTLTAAIVIAAVTAFGMQAQAKSYAKVSKISSSLKVSANYVNFTGKNALYSKAGTLKGAKLVKSTHQLKTLAASTNSLDSFMVLRSATTNRHSMYLKVRSLDGKTTGWIYNGKTTQTQFGQIVHKDKAHTQPAGGVTTFETRTSSPLTAEEKASYYQLATPGSATDGTGLIYNAPVNTASPAWGTTVVEQPDKTTSQPYANDTFIATYAMTRTREGDRWLRVQDLNNAKVSGYIKASALTKLPNATAKTGVTVNFVDYGTKQLVGMTIVPFGTGITQMNLLTTFNYQAIPAGTVSDYAKNAEGSVPTNGFLDRTAASNATPGTTLVYQVGADSE